MRDRLSHYLAVLLCMVSLVASAADAPVEGVDYQVLNPAQPTSNPAKIVVTEFFSYQCSHCYAFYPVITSWAAKLPKDVEFERVPVTLGRASWAPIAQAFYAFQALGKLDQVDRQIFSAIFVQNNPLGDQASIASFATKQGIDAAAFNNAYNSFGVKSSAARAEQLMRSHRVQGTPTVVVDGKYVMLNDGIKGYDELLARTDRVIAKARAEKAHK